MEEKENKNINIIDISTIETSLKRLDCSVQQIKYNTLLVNNMMKVVILDTDSEAIVWSVEDFEAQAKNLEGEDWEKKYDKSKFGKALELLINNHDSSMGVTWDDITYYLDEYCSRSYKNKFITLTKIKDLKFDGNHPNDVNVESVLSGHYKKDTFEIGKSIYLYPHYVGLTPIAWTSVVVKFDEENMEIHTKNSIYKLEVIN